LPSGSFPDEQNGNTIAATLHLSIDDDLMTQIKAGYSTDEFCKRVAQSKIDSWQIKDNL
jgi:hypothetical protein